MQFIAHISHANGLVARASVMDNDEDKPNEIAGKGMTQLRRDGERNSMTLERPKTDKEVAFATDFYAAVKSFGSFIKDTMALRESKRSTALVQNGTARMHAGEWAFANNTMMTVVLQAMSDAAVEARDTHINELLRRDTAAAQPVSITR